jgi:hypothetical protein
MIRIGLVACAKSKLDRPATARELYTSPLFRGSLRLALAQCDRVYVASALYELVDLDQVVAPYERTLAGLGKRYCEGWGERVVSRLADKLGKPYPTAVTLVLYAGDLYAQPLERAAHWRAWNVERPLAGMQIGQRLQYLRGTA